MWYPLILLFVLLTCIILPHKFMISYLYVFSSFPPYSSLPHIRISHSIFLFRIFNSFSSWTQFYVCRLLKARRYFSETSEDISPYATFQLSGQTTLPQNTMLHSFMYHEHAMTEGCASPPPAVSMQRNSPYYNIVSAIPI